ncbi:hypothetical protein GQ55_8G248800 [Panicum hallii var. hallii]|uniref:Uncharacterized protein n=1 Tax=Panicum hallii var. hallii TaxID=1504633 RepID=A0A2T7CQW1_9POAL|nr:hypothetical protein GQ55_8G248800 [Panicum hallii var. hallii]
MDFYTAGTKMDYRSSATCAAARQSSGMASGRSLEYRERMDYRSVPTSPKHPASVSASLSLLILLNAALAWLFAASRRASRRAGYQGRGLAGSPGAPASLRRAFADTAAGSREHMVRR